MTEPPKLLAQKRTAKHINQFIRITVSFEDERSFKLTVDRTQTIEYIAKQIEAEYFFRYSDNQDSFDNNFQLSQIYGSGKLSIPYGSTVGETIEFDDCIFAVGLPVANEPTDINVSLNPTSENYVSVFDLSNMGSVEGVAVIPESPAKMLNDFGSISDRFDSVLHNLISLQFFNEFCLQEYSVENVLFWIEAEVYKTIIDPSKAKRFATYLYLVYIKDGAPLNINMHKEIVQEIPWPFNDVPASDIFVVAQHYVYKTIKGHAYTRYENSKLFASFLEFKLSDRYSYVQAHVTWGEQFITEKSCDFQVIDVLLDPESEKSKKLIDDGRYETISSLQFRQSILSDTFARYFPIVSPVVRSYFNEDDRNEWRRKQVNVGKGKKLTKFFGQRPTSEHMNRQKSYLAPSREDSLSEISSQPSSTETDDFDENGGRRKKAGKLVEFFGQTLDRGAMVNQKLLQSSEVDAEQVAAQNQANNDQLLSYQITTNNLSGEEKRELTKKARKLLNVLGETLDEKTVDSLKQNMPTGPFEPGISDSRVNLVKPLKTSDILVQVQEELDPKQVQRNRLEKLSKFLGHRIAESDLAPESDSPKARRLTVEEKNTYKRRSLKLLSILGSNVPLEAIVNYNLKPTVFTMDQESLISLGDEDVLPLSIGDLSGGSDDETTVHRQKQLRLKKLRKLLGEDIRVGTVLNQPFLDNVEKSIDSEHAEHSEGLKEDIKLLKEITEVRKTTKALSKEGLGIVGTSQLPESVKSSNEGR
jgi:Regulator of G protein signaling domain